jgi:hypothetical protein
LPAKYAKDDDLELDRRQRNQRPGTRTRSSMRSRPRCNAQSEVHRADQGGLSGVPTSSLDLESWPNITLTLRGANNEPVPLTCSPTTYWQADCSKPGRHRFMIGSCGAAGALGGAGASACRGVGVGSVMNSSYQARTIHHAPERGDTGPEIRDGLVTDGVCRCADR